MCCAERWIAVASLGIAIAGCHGNGPVRVDDDYLRNSERIVKEADWGRLNTVAVELYDYGYTPRDLVLKAGQPYKLTLSNSGVKDHYYTAPDFYKAVATRKAMVNKFAEIKAPYFIAVEVLRGGGTLDLYFVPVVKGTYKVWCQIDDHEEHGSVGSITIE